MVIVPQEIRQHPILLSALRQWTFDKESLNILETTEYKTTIYNEVKSSIVGLLSLTISTDNNQQQVGTVINLSYYAIYSRNITIK